MRVRDADLADLAGNPGMPAFLAVDLLGKEVAGQLHGDGREALAEPAEEDHVLERADEADPVDPVMLVEALVLDRRGTRPGPPATFP